jgi:hypothetical protein
LDGLALRVHGGAAGLARKKDARKRRLENKEEKLKAKHVAKKQRTPKPAKREAEDVEEVEDVQFSGSVVVRGGRLEASGGLSTTCWKRRKTTTMRISSLGKEAARR